MKIENVLERMPQPSNLRALRTLRRKPTAAAQLPALQAEVRKVRVDAAHLRRYAAICGFPESDVLPIPYPQVLAIGLQMHVLTRPDFPLPLLGLVHLRNVIVQAQPVPADASLTLQVTVENGRRTDRGLEFDLVTACRAGKGEGWRGVATVLYRQKQAERGPRRKGPPEPDFGLGDYVLLEAPTDIGRRYGKIAGDMNPIHLYPLTAKLFGFPRHIAHGMWSLARSAALLQGPLGREPVELHAQFRQPLFLPARVALRYRRAEPGFEFALLARDSDVTHLNGTLR